MLWCHHCFILFNLNQMLQLLLLMIQMIILTSLMMKSVIFNKLNAWMRVNDHFTLWYCSIESITLGDKRIGIKTSVLEEKATLGDKRVNEHFTPLVLLCWWIKRRVFPMDWSGEMKFLFYPFLSFNIWKKPA